ncbi:MAG: DUF2799 domain-containing protein [Gammaproteobacteria bacterium]|nr:DUF2799 domain-containing protein [Gammaproteobacteria bacterium]
MHHTSRRILLALCTIGVAALATGCATTMSQTECVAADWYAIGLEDGARGQAMTRLTTHRKQCGEFGVTPDVQAYQQGRFEGLDYFCTLSNGLQVGKNGQSYAGACPSGLEYYFLTGYRLGREIHRVRKDMYSNRSAVKKAEKELQSEEVTDERTAELRYRLRTLEREFGRMQSRLEYLELEEQRIVVSDARSANLEID